MLLDEPRDLNVLFKSFALSISSWESFLKHLFWKSVDWLWLCDCLPKKTKKSYPTSSNKCEAWNKWVIIISVAPVTPTA